MRKLTVLLALLLALCMIVPLAACRKTPDPTPGPENVTTEQTESTLEPLEVFDLHNDEFKMLWPEVHSDGHFTHNELDSDGTSENVIDKAVYRRTSEVENTYNVDIVVELMFCSTIGKTVRNMVANGDMTYQAVATNVKFLTTSAVEGALADYNDMRFYKEQSWWDNKTMEDYAIGGARYFGMGDIIYSDNFYPYCVFANLGFAETYGIDADFYDLALNYEWTYEKLLELTQNVASAGTDEKWDYTATYGILLNANTARALYYGFEKNVLATNDDGDMEWIMTPSYADPVLTEIQKVFNSSNHAGYATDDDINHNEPGLTHAQTAVKMFDNNQALFYAEELIVSERLNSLESKMDFAILPMPLADNSQKEYHCVLNDAVVVSVPVLEDLDRASIILSAMGRASVETITPAFFENVLTYRYMTNGKSLETLKLILNSVKALDMGSLLNWGNIMTGFKNIALTGEGSFATVYAENIGAVTNENGTGAMDTFVAQVQNYQRNKR